MLKIVLTAACLMTGVASAYAQSPAPSNAPAAPAQTAPTQGQQPPNPLDALPAPADCTFDKVYICEPDKDGCAPSKELGTIDLPAKFLVHFERQIIASVSDTGLPHISAIQSASSAGDNITAQGVDGIVGWNLQMSRSEPGASLTIVSHNDVMTAFGTCKPAP